MARAKKMWIAAARERMKKKGTEGSFSSAARRSGKSTLAFAREKIHSRDPKMRKRANFALNVLKRGKASRS
jgi:hypothetical protein